ncbi:hypothetical protein EJD96_11910 [Herbaspirillum seropedicae]|uniref:hypothetical protein n=1 Tax=Herbaspirillum seropedicae TaxID=964 RepID=UPI00112327FE|nr:hypothetical protein [Herbaspirillum seropedicae]MDR6394219.1 hypothetical protein [Herbaspirillum seropedicae]QDD64814.1 hypothetical protein EJD96_11910 [Herbaspirillum seropedicae]
MTSKMMARRNRDTLKRKFSDGEMPAASAFSELIDSMLNIVDEGFDKTAADGLKVSQLNQGKLLSFYQNIDIKSPIWSVQLNTADGGLAFGNDANPAALTLRQRTIPDGEEVPPDAFELDLKGRMVADGRQGRPGLLEVKADGKWHDITGPLEGCNAFEIVAGVGKPGSGKYALMHAFALMTFNGRGQIDERQSHFGSKCNRLQLQWVADTSRARHAYILQMRVGCPYDNRDATTQTWVSYHISMLWSDPLMQASAIDPGKPNRQGAA